jgi:hypothetical protein
MMHVAIMAHDGFFEAHLKFCQLYFILRVHASNAGGSLNGSGERKLVNDFHILMKNHIKRSRKSLSKVTGYDSKNI